LQAHLSTYLPHCFHLEVVRSHPIHDFIVSKERSTVLN
jgi:hypothetical protein